MSVIKNPFLIKGLYRHVNPNASLDIEVLSILHNNSERAVLKIRYRTRVGRRVQYLGNGTITHERVRIYKPQWEDWSRL